LSKKVYTFTNLDSKDGKHKRYFLCVHIETVREFKRKGTCAMKYMKRSPFTVVKTMQNGGVTPEPDPPSYEELLMRQLFKESSFNPKAVSPAGARGLAQITPITEKELKRKGFIGEDFDPFKPKDAIQAQRAYMDDLMSRSWNKGSQEVKQAKALAAYNFGPSATVRVLNKAREAGVDIYNSLDWVDMLPEETSDYIDKILVGDNEEFEAGYAKKRKTFQLPE
jgi:hypothetical protein